MNKPADIPADYAVEQIPITAIRPSTTHIQTLRRKHFNAEALLELAASITKVGVLQPITVRRRLPEGTTTYEIVAGERRWLAADRAGLAHLPCITRDLADDEVLEAQLVENLQREDLNPLEEAEGYAELKQLKGYDAERIGELIGKSKSYVYARLKLTALGPDARAAMEAGTLDRSKGLLLARINSPKLQAMALKMLTETDYRGDTISYRAAFARLREKFMVDLRHAPFALDDATMFRMVPTRINGKKAEECESICACVTCPHYSRNDPELQRDLGADADVCTNREQYDLKVKIFWQRKTEAAKAEGRSIITGDEAKAIIPGQYDAGMKNGYLELDAECDDMVFPEPEPEGDEESPEWKAWAEREEAWRPPSYRHALGAEAPAAVLAAHPDSGKLVELVPLKEAAKILKSKGVELPKWKFQSALASTSGHDVEPTADPKQRAAEAARELEKRRVEEEYRKRLFTQIAAKWKGPLKQPELAEVAERLFNDAGYYDFMQTLYPKRPDFEKLKEDELARAIVLSLVADDVQSIHDKPAQLLELADRLKIDPKKIRTEVVRDLKPVSAPATEEPEAAAAPKKRAATKKAPAKKTTAKKAAKK